MIAKRMILALIVVTIVATSTTTTGADQSEDAASVGKVIPTAKVKALTGSWTATISAPGFPPFKALMTFNEDGGMIVSQATIVPFPPPLGRAVFSAGHGEWDKIRNGEFSFTFVALIHDENAIFLGTSRVSGNIEFDGAMEAFSATARVADLDPNGDVIFAFDASIHGERIRVEP